ncbi:peptidylprolyl isomerase [Polaribacter sp. Z014]|uniref:FKBP-type peptidyl-prolyl cis-trans isomerase n=1 Tax=unclassified Polaribacter TaxID=196858 RepID=UPI00193AE68E|nr:MULTISPECIES: peptidylprolyl isomerase [unclassified Polaribacter]MCL7764440.1 peptidylprolyl isomerase [Polaribacter sp. Z014]QVY66818.1 peptidylprolyl isomerase [Polaribacter sp. Q13]
MNKIKHIFAFAIISILLYSCGSSSSSEVDDFDYEAQALIDNDTLVQFLKNHYFDTDIDSIKALVPGKTALYDDKENLKTMKVKENDIDYNLYYYVNSVGTPTIDKGNPTVMDSVFVKYYGQRIVDTETISNVFDYNDYVWLNLVPYYSNGVLKNGVIRGWVHGFTNFKGGDNITDNGPITYKNGGKGILFIPSGLGYGRFGASSILANECILFYIDLYDFVKDTDHDNDGVPSIMEDPDGDLNPLNDDTDLDGRANYLDTDDDGDGVLTINEDANDDENPANDRSDPNNPDLPDYLNPDIN